MSQFTPQQRFELAHQGVSANPDSAEAHFNLASVLQDRQRFEEAVAHYRWALVLKPDLFQASNNLGNALDAMGRREEAIVAFRQTLRMQPNLPEAHFNLGNSLHSLGRIEQAIESFQKAIALRPDYADAINNLGVALRARVYRSAMTSGQAADLDEPLLAYRRALALNPDLPQAHLNLGNLLKDLGEIDDAIAHFRKAAQLKPEPANFSGLLYALHFHPDYGPREIWEEHARWNDRFVKPLAAQVRPHENERSAERGSTTSTGSVQAGSPQDRLRIGYVSPDFHDHPVGRFILPLLANHDHQDFEIFCYSDVRVAGAITPLLRSCPDVWRDTLGLSDENLAELIRQDHIDILVDLTMHMDGSRLLTFARKPAPVQITYLAYCSTTGAETIDYRFTDPYLDPPSTLSRSSGQAVSDDAYYSEISMRLRSYWCYEASPEAPPLAGLPFATAGFITFGCLNNFGKVSAPALAAWCELLRRVPTSRLIIHTHEGSHRQGILDRFAAQEVDPMRIEFAGYLPMDQYLATYNRIDIALDSFPYAGGTTTCEALWMGVPVVTCRGQTAVSRGGASILSQLGLDELIAPNADRYIDIAADLAGDLSRLRLFRSTLRQRMIDSPLMDAPAFARDVEGAYRRMWRTWCERQTPPTRAAFVEHFERANSLYTSGRADEAIVEYRRAIALRPDFAEAFNNLGLALKSMGQPEAVDSFRQAVQLKPDYVEALTNLANSLGDIDKMDDAFAACRRALAIRPDFAAARLTLGSLYLWSGQIDEAIQSLRQAESLDPNSTAADKLLYAIHFHPDYGPARIYEEHARWNRQYARPLAPASGCRRNDASPERRLRIGYVSPYFRDHVQAFFTVPLFSHHDHANFEVFCYSDVRSPDELTAQLRGYSDTWRETAGLSDAQLAELVLRDRIDILIDLTLHMSDNRLLSFAHKPAPVLVTWLGYPGTTGLDAMDYRLSDRYLDGQAPQHADEFYSEKTILLPHSFWCYDPLTEEPPAGAPPAVANGFVSFACLNGFYKITDVTLRVWAQLLSAVHNSRLAILAPEGEQRSRVLKLFQEYGIRPDRIEFGERMSRADYLDNYRRIDLCLDSIPYPGHTTTLDSLWMGVPVVTLAGATTVSRGGASILSNVGLTNLIASTPQQYVQIAAALASDLPRLAAVRVTLRERMLRSPLMNAPQFARDVEAAYRAMWKTWCSQAR